MACLILGVFILVSYFLNFGIRGSDSGSHPNLLEGKNENDPSMRVSGDAVKDPSAFSVNSEFEKNQSPEAGRRGNGSNRQGSDISEKTQKEVLKFGELHAKAVMSAQEESEMQELLRDRHLIKEVGQMLRSQKLLDQSNYIALQNSGIDFLKLALQSGDEEAIRDTIWDIIRDPQIEDSAIPLEDRQKMAAPKAELMFHASALRPDLFADIDMDLPGPASQQIWKNIQQRQSDNLEESIEEAEKFEKSKNNN